ncbi:MAG: YebC/PmpR family DNA-binding transcriptional regulator [Patescibacteria group bacterium]
MSGHNKWSNIQHKKGAADAKKSSIFTKLARHISVAAQKGGGDPTMNFSLRLAIEKAKAVNMPKDNIERAIKKGTGEDKDGAVFQEFLYEGFGPASSAILVETVSDNSNRTITEVKNIFTKNGGNMGGAGSVKWQFEQKGVIRFVKEEKDKINNWEEMQLNLMDGGVEDILETEEGIELYSSKENFQKMLETVEKNNIEMIDSGLEWVAKEKIDLSDEDSEKLANFVEKMEDLDDVKAVYTNEK